MDLCDSLQLFRQLAERAQTLSRVKTDDPPGIEMFWDHANQKLIRHNAESPLDAHILEDIDSVIQWCQTHRGSDVFVSAKEIVACWSEGARDYVRMPVIDHPRLAWCRGIRLNPGSTPIQFSQDDLVRALRVHLKGAVDPHVLPAISTLKFTKTESGESQVQHGKESIGRSVYQQVLGREDSSLIDEFTVRLDRLTTALDIDVDGAVRVDLSIDFTNQNFRLSVSAEELIDLDHKRRTWIADRLRAALGDEFSVYQGLRRTHLDRS